MVCCCKDTIFIFFNFSFEKYTYHYEARFIDCFIFQFDEKKTKPLKILSRTRLFYVPFKYDLYKSGSLSIEEKQIMFNEILQRFIVSKSVVKDLIDKSKYVYIHFSDNTSGITIREDFKYEDGLLQDFVFFIGCTFGSFSTGSHIYDIYTNCNGNIIHYNVDIRIY